MTFTTTTTTYEFKKPVLPSLWVGDMDSFVYLASEFNVHNLHNTTREHILSGNHYILMNSDTKEVLVRRAIYEIQAVGGEVYIYRCKQPLSVLVNSSAMSLKELIVQVTEFGVESDKWLESKTFETLSVKEAALIANVVIKNCKIPESELEQLRLRCGASLFTWQRIIMQLRAANKGDLHKTSLIELVLEVLNREEAASKIELSLMELASVHGVPYSTVRKLADCVEAETELLQEKEARVKKFGDLLSIRSREISLKDYLHPKLAVPLQQLAQNMGVDPGSLITVLLPTAASFMPPRSRVVVREGIGFIEPFIIYSGVLIESGNRKSPLLNNITHPLRDFQEREDHKYNVALADYEATKNNKEANAVKPAPPREYYVINSTAEALIEIKSCQNKGFLYVQDELSALFGSYNAYRGGRGADKENIILSGWNGNGFKTNRAGGRRYSVTHDNTSITGTTQPENLRKKMGNMSDEQGEWGRFLWNYPQSRIAYLPEHDTPFDVGPLLANTYSKIDSLQETLYRFSLPAWELYFKWHCQLEELKYYEPRQGMRSALAKMQGYTARIAGVLHVLWEICEGKVPQTYIGADIMAAAIELTKYYIGQVELIHSQGNTSHGEPSPILMKILEVAQRSTDGIVSAREVVRRCLSGRGKTQQAVTYIKELVEMGLGTIVSKGQSILFQCSNFVSSTVSNIVSSNTLPQKPVNLDIATDNQSNQNAFFFTVSTVSTPSNLIEEIKSEPLPQEITETPATEEVETYNADTNSQEEHETGAKKSEDISIYIDNADTADTADNQAEITDITSGSSVSSSVDNADNNADNTAGNQADTTDIASNSGINNDADNY